MLSICYVSALLQANDIKPGGGLSKVNSAQKKFARAYLFRKGCAYTQAESNSGFQHRATPKTKSKKT
ncbi:hypothetical protein [Herminiimonas sp. KBW02]|uniref:hypothetical protein n=1 Tax=Herminiimonas sp. KBW02 TaxID=2153363 RepID=UPI0011CD76EC|nr:hypothetical protein [Herminiimonas sp. KBW02]